MSSDSDKLKNCLQPLIDAANTQLKEWPCPDGYDSAGLAAIDAVYSANARYQSVRNITARVRVALGTLLPNDPARFPSFDLNALLHELALVVVANPQLSPAEAMAQKFFENRSVVGGRRKSEVVVDFTERVLSAHIRVPGIPRQLEGRSDFDALWALPTRLQIANELIRDLQAVPSVGPATARYFLLLLGGPFVKPDVMTRRFVSRCLGRDVSADECSSLLETAINELISDGLNKSVPEVDHLIWRYENGDLMLHFDDE